MACDPLASKTGDLTEVTSKHTFIDAESGESLEVKGYGQGKDSQDKGGPKAITSATKYAILKVFLIPTGDDPEKDDPPPPKNGHLNGNGKKPATNGTTPAQLPPKGNVASQEQQDQIKKLAHELGLKVQNDILPKMKITWPPDTKNAEVILARLREMKATANGRP